MPKATPRTRPTTTPKRLAGVLLTSSHHPRSPARWNLELQLSHQCAAFGLLTCNSAEQLPTRLLARPLLIPTSRSPPPNHGVRIASAVVPSKSWQLRRRQPSIVLAASPLFSKHAVARVISVSIGRTPINGQAQVCVPGLDIIIISR